MVEERYAIADSECLRRHYDRRRDGVLRFVSPACERTLGLKPEEITGKSLPELWVGEDGEKVRVFLAEVAATRSERSAGRTSH